MRKEHRPGAVLERLEVKFKAKLQTKTSWGRVEVFDVFRDAEKELRHEIIEELMTEPTLTAGETD